MTSRVKFYINVPTTMIPSLLVVPSSTYKRST